ncbi:Cut9 interacting protein Scn1 [Trypanosoma grayi]|uniref:Cut9 interacting protein Scn1 n=1 Tax=Trypanosoma grayi TaxID=71804 RepID=UPI0004F48F27|nr:Cut9 interacting protein Scn1 [Trypanosoma grayi]KEG06934.1 Cut9 interacting protein Scn1 [Trypanosoma grayi]
MSEQASRRGARCLHVTDSHCHLHPSASTPSAADAGDAARAPQLSCSIKRAVVCGTHPNIDWGLIETAAQSAAPPTAGASNDVIIPGFGIHPWFVPNDQQQQQVSDDAANGGINSNNSRGPAEGSALAGAGSAPGEVSQQSEAELLRLLEDALRRHPRAIVGEIGLDKLRGPPECVQLPFFVAQMKLAARYGRPVSVHCVRSFGAMLKVLQGLAVEDTPPAIVLHGFTGSLDFVKSAMMIRKRPLAPLHGSRGTPKSLPLRLFFGVGAGTSLRVKNFASKTLPFLLQERRALLETDAHHTFLLRDGADVAGAGGDIAWNRAGCGQLAEVIALAGGGNAEAEDALLQGCEEAFVEAFSLQTATEMAPV